MPPYARHTHSTGRSRAFGENDWVLRLWFLTSDPCLLSIVSTTWPVVLETLYVSTERQSHTGVLKCATYMPCHSDFTANSRAELQS